MSFLLSHPTTSTFPQITLLPLMTQLSFAKLTRTSPFFDNFNISPVSIMCISWSTTSRCFIMFITARTHFKRMLISLYSILSRTRFTLFQSVPSPVLKYPTYKYQFLSHPSPLRLYICATTSVKDGKVGLASGVTVTGPWSRVTRYRYRCFVAPEVKAQS